MLRKVLLVKWIALKYAMGWRFRLLSLFLICFEISKITIQNRLGDDIHYKSVIIINHFKYRTPTPILYPFEVYYYYRICLVNQQNMNEKHLCDNWIRQKRRFHAQHFSTDQVYYSGKLHNCWFTGISFFFF